MENASLNERKLRQVRIARRVRSVEAASIAGIAYAVLGAVALLRLASYPSLGLDDDALTAWFDDTTHQALLIGALGMAAVSSIAFLWFIAVIRRRLGDLEDKFFATVFFGSGIAYVAVWMTGAAALAAPAVAMVQLDAATASPGAVSLAGGLGGALILVVAPRIQAVFIFTTSTLIMRSRVLPGWLAVVGYLSGLGLFLIPLVAVGSGFVFPAWVLVVSVVMLLRRADDFMIERPPTGGIDQGDPTAGSSP